ncbi:MAG: asparaginase, partial [Gemmatimonadales bacterium]
TDLMTAWRGRIVAKVGAEGIYCAAIPEIGIGIALKVEDGDMPSAPPALLEVIQQCLERLSPSTLAELPLDALAAHRVQPIRNTRGKQTGERRAVGVLRFPDAESGELVRPPERSA